jgi:hypothetical protein
MSREERGPERDCAAEAQQRLQITDSSSCQRGRAIITNPQLSKENLVTGPDSGLIPAQTSRLIVRCDIT